MSDFSSGRVTFWLREENTDCWNPITPDGKFHLGVYVTTEPERVIGSWGWRDDKRMIEVRIGTAATEAQASSERPTGGADRGGESTG